MTGITVGAPVLGWNAIDSVANMAPDFALVLENFIPSAKTVGSRRGYAPLTTTARANAETLVSYNGSTPKLLLGGAGNIYDVTAGGAGTDLTGALGAFANNQWHTNGFKDRIIFCNAADTPLEYIGASNTVAQLSLTGPTATDLAGSVTYKGRVFYWEKPSGPNPRSFWYAGAGAYTGTLTKFDVTEFSSTGYIVSCAVWTKDGGEGMDDLFVIILSTGETVIYAGSDPGDSTDWHKIGVFSIGEPLGIRPVTQVGGDAVVLSKDGYLILSQAIHEARYSEKSLFSYLINPAAAEAAQRYGSNFGWEATLFPDENLFVVNVPISATNSEQHVRNTTTGAWCKFTGINATAFAVHANTLYFAGTDGIVYRYQGRSDDGGFIPLRGTQAYQDLGNPHIKKQVTAVEVFTNYAYPKFVWSSFWSDFKEKDLVAIPDPPEPEPSDWDVGDWDVAQWDPGSASADSSIRNASGHGYHLAHTMRIRSRAQEVVWYKSKYHLKGGGSI